MDNKGGIREEEGNGVEGEIKDRGIDKRDIKREEVMVNDFGMDGMDRRVEDILRV